MSDYNNTMERLYSANWRLAYQRDFNELRFRIVTLHLPSVIYGAIVALVIWQQISPLWLVTIPAGLATGVFLFRRKLDQLNSRYPSQFRN